MANTADQNLFLKLKLVIKAIDDAAHASQHAECTMPQDYRAAINALGLDANRLIETLVKTNPDSGLARWPRGPGLLARIFSP